MSDEECNLSPPSAETVARRALVLSAVSCRGIMDGDLNYPNYSADLATQAYDWLRLNNIADELSEWEREVLESPWGTLSLRDRINASWLSEAVAVFAWALGKFDLPSYEEQCDPYAAARSLGFLYSPEKTVLRSATLLQRAALQEYNEFIYNLHWRVRDYSLNRRSYNFELLAKTAWSEPVLRHGLKLVKSDLCVNGVAIADAKEEDTHRLTSIIQERHRASNWLIGYASEDFYEVTTDT